jgi:plastocyanin
MRLPYVLGNSKDISKVVIVAVVGFAIIFGSIAYYLSTSMTPITASSLSTTPPGTQPPATNATAVVFTLPASSNQAPPAGSVQCGVLAASGPALQVGMANGVGGPFTPQTLNLKIGANNTVTWTNNDPKAITHTVTSNQGLFHSGDMAGNAAFTCTFTAPGTYYYRCLYHPLMVGTIIVRS